MTTEQQQKTPEGRLRAIFTRELDSMQDRHALTCPDESGRGIASAIIDAWRWLDRPGTTWKGFKLLIQEEFETTCSKHAQSAGTVHEDLFAYARAGGLRGVLGWIQDIEGR